MSKLFEAFCARKMLNINEVKFLFDGKVIKPQETPSSLALDKDDLIDAQSK
jgi:hypothetical protein